MTEVTTEVAATATATAPDKRLVSIAAVLDGIKARVGEDNMPVFEQIAEGNKITLLPDNDKNKNPWPSITVGVQGGIVVNELRSYPEPDGNGGLYAAVNGDVLYAKQNERDAKRKADAAAKAEAAAKAAAAPAETKTAEEEVPAAA